VFSSFVFFAALVLATVKALVIILITSNQRILTRLHHTGDFSLGKFSVILDCFCGQPNGTMVNSMRGNPDVMGSPLGMVLGGVQENPDVIAFQKFPFPLGIWIPI